MYFFTDNADAYYYGYSSSISSISSSINISIHQVQYLAHRRLLFQSPYLVFWIRVTNHTYYALTYLSGFVTGQSLMFRSLILYSQSLADSLH